MKKIFFVVLSFCFFLLSADLSFAEDLTLTTYYPVPKGIYNQLTVQQDLRIIPKQESEVSGCSFNTKGTLYYDETAEEIKVCKKRPDGTYGFESMQGETGLGTRLALPAPIENGCNYTNYSNMEDDNISTRAEAEFMLPYGFNDEKKGSVTWDFGSNRINALNITFATGSRCYGLPPALGGRPVTASSVVQVSADNLNWYDLASASSAINCEPLGATMLYGNSQTKIFTSPMRYVKVINKARRTSSHGHQWVYFYINELAAYE